MPHVRRDQTTQQLRDDLTGKKPRRRAGTGLLQTLAPNLLPFPVGQDVRSSGATDKAGTASRGSGRKTVVSGDPVKPRSGQAPSAQRGKNASNRAKVAAAKKKGYQRPDSIFHGMRDLLRSQGTNPKSIQPSPAKLKVATATPTKGKPRGTPLTPQQAANRSNRSKIAAAKQKVQGRKSVRAQAQKAAIKQGQAGRTERARRKSSM